MKKIEFNVRWITDGYDKNLNLQTELKKSTGYLFEREGYKFVVHKIIWPSGLAGDWRVTEFSTGCTIAAACPTCKKALAAFEKMTQKEGFIEELDRQIKNNITIYGKAN